MSGFSQNAAIFIFSIFQRYKFESSRYGVSSTIQKSSKVEFNPNPFLQPRYCIDPTCRDDPTYVDEGGYVCDQWVGDNCDDAFPGWASSGYTQAGENLVLEKCKYSCGKCPRLQTPAPCDAMECGAVTGNVRCLAGQILVHLFGRKREFT